MGASVSSAGRKGARTAGQGGAGWAVVEAIEAFHLYNFDERQYGITIFILGGVICVIQNLIEDRLGKGILRTPVPREASSSSNDGVNAIEDGLADTPQPVQTENGPRDVDPPEEEQPPQDPNYIPPSDDDEEEMA